MPAAGAFDLPGVVPWGRVAREYEAFFALGALPRAVRVLDCGGGPASFAAEWSAAGRAVVAADPLYARDPAAIRAAFADSAGRMTRGMEAAHDRFAWGFYGSVEAVLGLRQDALDRFLADRAAAPGRYVAAALPQLPFATDAFDLALSSHLLFLYADALDLGFHVAALTEMLRVAPEARVFPLLDLDGAPSRHVEPVAAALSEMASVEIVPVPFEFQKGATRMLRLRRHRVAVRPAEPGDAVEASRILCASIRQLCGADHGGDPVLIARWTDNKTPEGVAAWIAATGVDLFVAERGGCPAAVGGVGGDAILLLYVAPEHRCRGVGRALLGALERVLKERGAAQGRLTSTRTAHRFYRAAGWRDAGAPVTVFGMTGHPMVKDL